MGASVPPLGAAGLLAGALAMPPIEAFAALAGDGITDDSAALKAAHDAAATAGVRELYCARTYLAPGAYNLGNVLFRGPGTLLGTYRKRIVPMSVRAHAVLPRIVPEIHLRRFAKALAPTVVIWGDSTGTQGPGAANHVSESEMIWSMLAKVLARDNPGRTINLVNRSIGGSAVTDYSLTGTALQNEGLTLPSWFANTAAPWSGYVSNQAPDLVVINFGQNAAANHLTLYLQQVIDFCTGLAKVPDILLCTNTPRSTQADPGAAMVAAQEARDFAAGATRSVADFYNGGYGLLDFHRVGCMARDGFDPAAQVVTSVPALAGTTATLPAMLPTTGGDFDLAFTVNNTGGAAFGGATNKIDVLLSPQPGNTLRIGQSGTAIQLVGFTGAGSGTWLPALATGVAMPATTITFEVSLRGSYLTLNCQGSLLYKGQVLRQGGRFQPTIAYGTGSGVATIGITSYAASAPAPVQPSLTDAEMFGSGGFAQGGNAINHPASPAYENIHALVFDTLSLCALAGGRPVQAIAAAAAVNPDAALVALTGPAGSGTTYAITLAAPRAQDGGNLLAIEMAATTGSNSVTLALGTVTGGTAATTCTWSAAGQRLVLMAVAGKWDVLKQDGVALS